MYFLGCHCSYEHNRLTGPSPNGIFPFWEKTARQREERPRMLTVSLSLYFFLLSHFSSPLSPPLSHYSPSRSHFLSLSLSHTHTRLSDATLKMFCSLIFIHTKHFSVQLDSTCHVSTLPVDLTRFKTMSGFPKRRNISCKGNHKKIIQILKYPHKISSKQSNITTQTSQMRLNTFAWKNRQQKKSKKNKIPIQKAKWHLEVEKGRRVKGVHFRHENRRLRSRNI